METQQQQVQVVKRDTNQEEIQPIEQVKPQTNNQCFFYFGDSEQGKKILNIFQGIHYSIFITVVTVITLFADDFRVIFFTADADIGFSILNLICMFFFFVEIVVLSICKENYFFGFYFWLDIISTATMAMDLVWIDQVFTGGNGAVQSAASIAKVARASRASKIGANATKLIRIIRLIRFLKLYKTASKRLARESTSQKVIKIKSGNQAANQNSKILVAGEFDQNLRGTNKRWTRFKKDCSCAVIPFRGGQVSLIQLGLNQKKKFTMKQINNFSPYGSSQAVILRTGHALHFAQNSHLAQIPHLTQIPHQQLKNQDLILQSIKRIEQAAQKRQTQNIRNLAGYHAYFRELYSMSNSGQQSLSAHKIQDSQTDINNLLNNQTKVGVKIKNQIQKNLVLMILLIIISIPLFNASTWFQSNLTSYQKGIYELEKAASINLTYFDRLDDLYIKFMMALPQKLIYFSIQINDTCCQFPDDYENFKIKYQISDQTKYRTDDLVSYQTEAGSAVVFQSTYISSLTSQLNIGRTLFVCLILIVSTLLFSRDIEIIALQPLENMFQTVEKIALNPLDAIRAIEEKNMCIESIEPGLMEEKGEQTEPNILENLIVKIGGLLAVGFGQAGTQIISKVIQNPQFVNVIIPGEKVIGIYGFCDIRNFTDATQILQAEVMVFVNQIAQICHSIVNAHCGSPNKNIGDAFLLVWKYKESDMKFDQKQGHQKKLQLVETKRVKQLADLAVLSFVRMIADITKSETLQKYKNNKDLKNRIKDYKGVKMGFGLHIGWSIQGPIGSQFKVDASYLSPSVNMASRLEAGTKQYGVPMLITEEVYDLMTQNKNYLRQVDRVMFEGYNKPTNLYTVDLHVQSLLSRIGVKHEPIKTKKQIKYQKIKQNIKRNKLLEDIESKYVTKQLWQDKDIQILRQRYTHNFYEEWNKGIQYYINGQWQNALQVFKKTIIMAPDHQDGPSQTLINFMQSYNGKAPDDWKGYRQAVL